MENYGTLILDYYPIFSFVDVIESYEGPTLIRLIKESTKEEYVAKWCEQTGNLERWLIVRADSELITISISWDDVNSKTNCMET